MEDWRENRLVLQDSMISNSGIYYLNWFHCDSWSNPSPNVDVPEENIIDGLDMPMNATRSWIMSAETPAACTHYSFVTFVRYVHSHVASVDIVV
jgi:hypothetical protein